MIKGRRVFVAPIDAPGGCGQQPVARMHRLVAGMHQHKATGAVSILHHAGPDAALAEQRRLLIAADACDGYTHGEQLARGFGDDAARWHHFRQHRPRNCEQVEQLFIPIAAVYVE